MPSKSRRNTKKKISKKKSNNSKKLKLCSPHTESNNYGSCYTRSGLEKIAKAWNINNNDKIKFSARTTDKQLTNLINKKMKKQGCSNDYCWREIPFIKQHYGNDSDLNVFKPRKPQSWNDNPRTWLNTNDINRVLRQYEQKYPEFKYYGAVPIDFDAKLDFGTCVVNELCTINIASLYKKNKTKIGIVFNIDPHYKPGQHWISMFCDLDRNEISFWDSFAEEPPKEIKNLINKLKEQGKTINKDLKVNINQKRHQYKNTECGIYSMHFIIKLLEGKSFKTVTNNIIRDDKMWKNRSKYYIDL